MRCFIAVELDKAVQDQLAKLQESMRRRLHVKHGAIKWVCPENVHLTLKFLGDVDNRLIPEICSAVSDCVEGFSPFEFELADCGCFPRIGPARVLWVGIKYGSQKLLELQESVELFLDELGFPPENRRFSAHLTLARIKNAEAGRLVSNAVHAMPPCQPSRQAVSAITLFQSELTPTGPVYTALCHKSLCTKE